MCLFPLFAFLHFSEEAPWFTRWAKTYASAKFSFAHWLKIHALGFVFAIMFSCVTVTFPNRVVIFSFFAVGLASTIWNAVFHLGASLIHRTYCPGVITAVLFYPFLFGKLSGLALRSGLIGFWPWLMALGIAGVVHVLDVLHNVYFRRLSLVGPK